MTVQEEARAVLAVLDSPEKWTQNRNARNAEGIGVYSTDPSAVCFCLIGAAKRAGLPLFWDDEHLGERLQNKVPSKGVAVWNDAPERTYADVVALLTEIAESAA